MSLDFTKLDEQLKRLTADPKQKNNDFLKNFVKMPAKNGAVEVRLLAGLDGRDFYCSTRTHKLGQDKSARNIHCPRTLQGDKWIGKCSICEYYSWLYQQADKGAADAEALVAEAKSIKPVERYYYNVIVRQNSETGQSEKDGPLILSVGVQVHTKILMGMCGSKQFNEPRLGDVMDPTTGRDFKIIKKMKPGGQYPEYADSKFMDVSRLGTSEQVESWLAARHDIYVLRKVFDEATIKKALRVFKGMEEDTRSSFNPEEFLPNRSKPVAHQEVPTVANSNNDVNNDGDNNDDDDLSLADAGFIKDLHSSINKEE